MTYAGRSLSLVPDEKIAGINEACKNHLINEFGRRGLVALGYSDSGHEDEIAAKAKEINKRFKKEQVIRYNEDNASRRLKNLGGVSPSKKVKEYALELGIRLDEPYVVNDVEKEAIAKTSVENEVLKQKLAAQQTEMDELKKMMKQLLEAKDEQAKPRMTGAQRTLHGQG